MWNPSLLSFAIAQKWLGLEGSLSQREQGRGEGHQELAPQPSACHLPLLWRWFREDKNALSYPTKIPLNN